MKYFKHHTERDREFLDLVFERFGHEGCSVWWKLQEVLAVEIERQVDDFKYNRAPVISPVMTVDLNWLAGKCRVKPEILLQLAAFALESGKFSIVKQSSRGSRITIEAPNLLEDSDEYFPKQIAKICKERGLDAKSVPRLSGQCRDNVPTLSDQNKQQQRREDKNRRPRPPAASPDGAKPEEPPPPPPPAPPRVAVAVVVAPEIDAVPAASPGPSALERPHYGLSMLLLLGAGLTNKAANRFAAVLPVREIAAAARGAGGEGVRDPAGWCRRALEQRWCRDPKPLPLEAEQELLEKLSRMESQAAAKIEAMRPAPGPQGLPKRDQGESDDAFLQRVQDALAARQAVHRPRAAT